MIRQTNKDKEKTNLIECTQNLVLIIKLQKSNTTEKHK